MINQGGANFARLVASAVMALAIAPCAQGTQHLITPGDDWQKLNGKLKAGDEVILMPGKHRGATLDDLKGTTDRPIIIHGLDSRNPAMIVNQRDGIRLNRPRHVVLKDITLADCALGGISVSDGNNSNLAPATSAAQSESEAPLGPLTISNVRVQRTGLRLDRDAISLIGVDHVKIESCHIEGWNSCGIELVGCHSVSIDRCTFKPAEGFSQVLAIQVRAGSERVAIRHCRFESAGKRVICVGGNSKTDHFRPRLLAEAKPAGRAEAALVTIENCLIAGGKLPLAFVNAEDCTAQNCTIIRPRGSVFAVLNEHTDPRIASSRSITFGSNLITWEAGDVQKLVEVGKAVAADAIQLQSNLWWSSQPSVDREQLGPLPGQANWPQTVDVDPKLDDRGKPTDERAMEFGVQGP